MYFLPKGGKVPTQLADLQAVFATRESVTHLLDKLYIDQNFTSTKLALNRVATRQHLEPIADLICDAINGVSSKGERPG